VVNGPGGPGRRSPIAHPKRKGKGHDGKFFRARGALAGAARDLKRRRHATRGCETPETPPSPKSPNRAPIKPEGHVVSRCRMAVFAPVRALQRFATSGISWTGFEFARRAPEG